MFNEATRVQMPALVHLTRLGYQYFGKIHEDDAKEGVYDPDTNILLKVFRAQFCQLNPTQSDAFEQTLSAIRKELNDDDLVVVFISGSKPPHPLKLIDFDHPEANVFHCTAEFTCKNGQAEFRPDITLFVNGLPLCFVEVKKPNNSGGIVAESTRMNKRAISQRKVSSLHQHDATDDLLEQYGIRHQGRSGTGGRRVLLHGSKKFCSLQLFQRREYTR